MIIKASQRAGASALASHLSNGDDNEHIHLHQVRGFLATTIHGALIESEAVSQATKCRQHLFSVSLSPPQDKKVSTSLFDDTANQIEQKLGLKGLPRIMVFHEKQGRRHCHVVWSRIDVMRLKAVNLPFFKNKLMEISKSLYLENNWDLPQGHIDRHLSNPLNYSIEEWQLAKRQKRDPKLIKNCIRRCWQTSNSKRELESKLNAQGYYLACGNPRRSFVLVDWAGQVRSLSRQCGATKAELSERLGNATALQSVEETRNKINARLKLNLQGHLAQLHKRYQLNTSHLQKKKSEMTNRHKAERKELLTNQEKRKIKATILYQKRFKTGIKGLWQRLSGQRWRITKEREMKALIAYQKDQAEMDKLIFKQLNERQELQNMLNEQALTYNQDISQLQNSIINQMNKEQASQLTQLLIQSQDLHL